MMSCASIEAQCYGGRKLENAPYECIFGREARAIFDEDWLFLRKHMEDAQYKRFGEMRNELKTKHWKYINRRRRNRVYYVDVFPGDMVRWFPDRMARKNQSQSDIYRVLDGQCSTIESS